MKLLMMNLYSNVGKENLFYYFGSIYLEQ